MEVSVPYERVAVFVVDIQLTTIVDGEDPNATWICSGMSEEDPRTRE
jgi:hypothetical protein